MYIYIHILMYMRLMLKYYVSCMDRCGDIFIDMYTCVYIHVCTYAHIYIHNIHTCIHLYTYMNGKARQSPSACIRIAAVVCIYVCLSAWVHAFMQCVNLRTRARTNIHMCTHTYIKKKSHKFYPACMQFTYQQ